MEGGEREGERERAGERARTNSREMFTDQRIVNDFCSFKNVIIIQP